MRALGKQRNGAQKFCDLAIGIAVAEYRQRERRFCNEDVTWHEFEWRAGRIGDVFVIAGGDDPQPLRLDRDLRRAEHVPSRVERHGRPVERYALPVLDRLRRAGEIVAIAQPHEIECLLRCQHRAMAGACMVGMAVRDQRPLDRPCRIDMEAAELAAYAGRCRHQNVFRTHREL